MDESTTTLRRGQARATLDDFLRSRVRELIEQVLQEEVTATIGSPPSARPLVRHGYRHGSRLRSLTLTAGTVEITIPRARLHHPDGTHTEWQSALLPRYRRLSRAAEDAVVRTYLAGTNTRRIKAALAPLLGRGPLSKSAVSRLVQRLEDAFQVWRTRELGPTALVYLYLDAVYPRVRCAGRVTSLPVLVALGVPAGDKVVVALQTSGAETGAAWTALVSDLANRGLRPPQLVISDGNRGLRQALVRVWPGIAHQRCVVHKQRNVVSAAPRHVQAAVRDSYHAVVHAETLEAARAARDGFVRRWRTRAPRAVASLLEADDDLLTFHRFPVSQHRSLRSTNVIERLNEEFRRRVKTQTACPSEGSVLVLFHALVASGTVRMKQNHGLDRSGPADAASGIMGEEHTLAAFQHLPGHHPSRIAQRDRRDAGFWIRDYGFAIRDS